MPLLWHLFPAIGQWWRHHRLKLCYVSDLVQKGYTSLHYRIPRDCWLGGCMPYHKPDGKEMVRATIKPRLLQDMHPPFPLFLFQDCDGWTQTQRWRSRPEDPLVRTQSPPRDVPFTKSLLCKHALGTDSAVPLGFREGGETLNYIPQVLVILLLLRMAFLVILLKLGHMQ